MLLPFDKIKFGQGIFASNLGAIRYSKTALSWKKEFQIAMRLVTLAQNG